MIVKLADLEVEAKAALILATTCAVTAVVVTVNFADVLPARTITDAGSVADVELLDRLTEIPPAGAAVPSVTVPVDVFPPTKEEGLKDSPVTLGGLMVRPADSEIPFNVPVIVAGVALATETVLIVNEA